ncbi:Uncharacterised protein [Vibrio cholerae]|nr:Uncharacterised protein [Vibrio cholerae]
MVHQRTFNGLTDPPCCVGREAETAFWIEFLNRTDQTKITFFNQIEQC